MVINGIEYRGISKELPENLKYFNQDFFTNIISIDFNNRDIKELLSVAIDIDSNILKILQTSITRTSEGKKMLGKKLLIELNFNYKIKYLSHNEKNIYFFNKRTTKSNSLILPSKINNKNLEELTKKNTFTIKTYIEYIYAKIKNSREIIVNTSFVINGENKGELN